MEKEKRDNSQSPHHKHPKNGRLSRTSGLQPHQLPDRQTQYQHIDGSIGHRHDGIEERDINATAKAPPFIIVARDTGAANGVDDQETATVEQTRDAEDDAAAPHKDGREDAVVKGQDTYLGQCLSGSKDEAENVEALFDCFEISQRGAFSNRKLSYGSHTLKRLAISSTRSSSPSP